jgi:tyrosyl-tRNA synthetase
VPEQIEHRSLSGAPLGIAAVLKSTGLAASGSDANRLIDGAGVRVDSHVVSDKTLKLSAGTYVVQVGKRKFVRVTLS